MRHALPGVLLTALLLGCAPMAEQAATPAAPPPLPPILPFAQAVQNAATTVLSTNIPADAPRTIVIDPLVDGVTGDQSAATRQIGARIAELARERFPQYRIVPFTAENVAQRPLVMVGTFTAVNAQNQTAGERAAYRFCLVLADLNSGRTVAKGVARAQLQGVDTTPAGFFQQSPVWSEDPAIRGYVNTCQATRVGDAIPPDYLRGIQTAALVQEAIALYEAGRFADSLAKYEAARQSLAGDQLRVLNGLYLTNRRLRRNAEAERDFGLLADFGLQHTRLAVKLLYRPGSTGFLPGPETAGVYPMWLRRIADRAAARESCLEVRGHTSASGPPAANELLATRRAEAVRDTLTRDAPALARRVVATGVGARETLIGTGRDDASDALDRRVEFRVLPSCG